MINASVRLYPARVIFLLMTVGCMVLIFLFSSDNAVRSSSKSGRVTDTVVEIIVNDYDELSAEKQLSIRDKAEHIIRKLAHYSVYAMLGFCASMAVGQRKLFGKGSLGVLIFCFLYACSDEIHQIFVPGRAGMFTDVLIDTGGALTGMLCSFVIFGIVKLISNRKNEKKERITA